MEYEGGEAKKKRVDAADYLFKTTIYHDRHITVGKSDTDQMETIGISSSHLVAHSKVFREMFVESELADQTGKNTHITDVTPEVFKLMLRYVYGGELPEMSQETATQLALCADKYNIQPLVAKAATMLVPTDFQDVFPALRFVLYMNAPDLEKRVITIIEQQTDRVIAHNEFFTLDANCLEFIAKQERLAVSELELWKGLVKWAKQQTTDPTEMRKLLEKPLLHVRLLTLTHDEVIKEVKPLKILTPMEITDLLSAITDQVTLKSSRFSSTKQVRESPLWSKNKVSFYCSTYPKNNEEAKGCELKSSFTLKSISNRDIEIVSLICKTISLGSSQTRDDAPYDVTVTITVHTYLNSFLGNTETIEISGRVMADDKLVLPMKLNNGSCLILKPSFLYLVSVEFSCPHPVFKTWRNNYQEIDKEIERFYKEIDSTKEAKYDAGNNIEVKYRTYFHIQEIEFMYEEDSIQD